MRGLALLLCLVPVAVGQEDWARVTNVQMPAGLAVQDVAYGDIDGDGLRDLVVAVSSDDARQLRIHLQRTGKVAFRPEADHVLAPVWKDVVAYAVADVHADAGAEVALFTVAGVWAWRPRASEREAVAKLLEASFLWQLPDPWRVAAWSHGARDLNGDGLTDLLVPEPGGYRLAIQRRDRGFDTAFLAVPDDRVAGPPDEADADRGAAGGRVSRYRLELTLSDARDLLTGGPLLTITDVVPAPQFADWDADGDLDLLARTERWVHVWLQGPGGRLGARPSRSDRAPVVADRDRSLDISYSAHVVDLDLDRRVDCVLLAGDQRSEEVRTQVMVYLQDPARKSPLFGAEGLPQQLLVLDGFAGQPSFDDVDGDGYPDLKVGAVRPDLIETLRSVADQTIRAEFYVYRNRKGVFSRRPDLTFRAQVEVRGLRRARSALIARFIGDVTGDGLAEFLLRDEETRLRLFLTRRARTGLSLHARPLWELRIAAEARVRIAAARGGKASDLLVLEPEQVLHVRFP
ncbi:MAG: hypothetical protein ACYTEZ_00995 [Planctomycetota bacterium]|jgi:hypothetical protein